jgi:inhibitor of cysteine peptidase
MIEIGPGHNGSSVSVPLGQSVTLALPENPTTGYRWRVVGAPGGIEVSDRFEPGDPARPGQGGRRVFQLQPLRAGKTRFSLSHARPGEAAGGEAFAVELDVEAGAAST